VEATCQVAVEVRDYYGVRITPDEPCGAPIPRLRDGECARCSHDRRSFHSPVGCYYLHEDNKMCECDAYLGPLASTCTRGHPVAVPSEAERRG
jgi:hypothetical protein